jgi:hypothetical protein
LCLAFTSAILSSTSLSASIAAFSCASRSLDFFKREAKKRRVPYQRMIRAPVDTYAEKHAGGKS